MSATLRPTIRDVARAAGVSTTTVSDALSGRGRLSTATRDRVASVARELSYAVNTGASNLRRGRTGAIGLYVPDHTVGLAYYMELAVGAAEAALAMDLALTLLPPSRGHHVPPRLPVDGVIVSDPVLGDPMLTALVTRGVPVVTCERDLTPGAQHAGRVEVDHATAVAELLDHLADRGATRVALLCPGPETSFGADIRAAYLHWSASRDRAAVVRDVPFACEPGDVTVAMAGLLDASPAPDAVVAVPDGGAAMALQAALRHGCRVPEDLLLTSYVDNAGLLTLSPPVTAVDLAPREMGRRAAQLMADVLAGTVPAGHVEVMPARLVVRASSTR